MPSRLMLCLLVAIGISTGALAADPAPIRITVIADLNDDLYDARAGRGGVDATRMAVADFGGSVLGRPVVVDALNDHNKAAEAPGLATQAYDAGADLLMDLQNAPDRDSRQQGRDAAAQARDQAPTRQALRSPAAHVAATSTTIPMMGLQSRRQPLIISPHRRMAKRWVIVAGDAGFGRGAVATFTPIIAAHGGEVLKTFIVPLDNHRLFGRAGADKRAPSGCGRPCLATAPGRTMPSPPQPRPG